MGVGHQNYTVVRSYPRLNVLKLATSHQCDQALLCNRSMLRNNNICHNLYRHIVYFDTYYVSV